MDAGGNVYVADRGNNRIQVFDNNGTYKSSITAAGNPQAICISPGAHQYLYASNSNPVNDIDTGRRDLQAGAERHGGGQVRPCRHGRSKEFNAVNAIDCRVRQPALCGGDGQLAGAEDQPAVVSVRNISDALRPFHRWT